MIYIEQMQGFAHIQDLGRFGLRRFGIGHAGAMDSLALQAGNLLLDNPDNAPAIELTLAGMTLTFDCSTPFCITGAIIEAELDGMPVLPYWRYTAKARQRLTLKRFISGNYAYLCVAGGFNVPLVLGSASTDLKAEFGGYHGRLLKSGDHLATGRRDTTLSQLGVEPIAFTNKIYATQSSEFDAFNPQSQQAFFSQGWQLQANSNRMGYRFSGLQPLALNAPLEMLSYAAPAGTVQVPPDGQPIILMADAQTTGGYPKIACVIQADLGRLAQNPFGSNVYFECVSREQALSLYQANQDYLNRIRRCVYEAR
ncbi:biotin-dependent carboxyltransferase family protein [Muribacter muris]|uniref:Biotin-dependent carboxyltransferase family protein n=1 Tax=Muribacter muris TaxID=67855 RepID=A0A4Y9K0D6_9PAST|nr:biotin-dependent carboxyltransferase family protein [Muribacter muris]MBF0785136.1 biotin-dependent carboxyltransferase family protein [Muribacter muris]MBF0826850.1 biotin-dependent carboxyltransferase family protein [Muribacter muris]TFV10227.1 biotin-dependent carboxyltransferase family protein [Muribacter muris]